MSTPSKRCRSLVRKAVATLLLLAAATRSREMACANTNKCAGRLFVSAFAFNGPSSSKTARRCRWVGDRSRPANSRGIYENTSLCAADSRRLRFLAGGGRSSFDPVPSVPSSTGTGTGTSTSEHSDTSSGGTSRNGAASVLNKTLSSSSEGARRVEPQPQQQRLLHRHQILPNPTIKLTEGERKLFKLLSRVVEESEGMSSTLRVAGGWVRDKLLATDEFRRELREYPVYRSEEGEGVDSSAEVVRLTRKFLYKSRGGPSMGRQGTKIIGDGRSSSSTSRPSLLSNSAPVDIDIALDDMLGREFADHLNEWLGEHGRDTISVGVVLRNPEKSKHLETATMKIGGFWIDFVNLRAEEYTEQSRIPDLMRIGTATEDAQRRDLTINSLFYNINTGEIEDMTGRGLSDLRRGIIATPLPPLTTLLDDPLRVLRSVRFAARLHFAMGDELRRAASDPRVRSALAQKVARERVGGEVDLMLRSPDPVGAMRLLINLNLVDTVFPLEKLSQFEVESRHLFSRGLVLLSTAHDHLVFCKSNPPVWCSKSWSKNSLAPGAVESVLLDDEEGRRLLWYAAFLKPLFDRTEAVHARRYHDESKAKSRGSGKISNRSVVAHLMVDELKRPARDADAVDKILKAANHFSKLIGTGCDLTATAILLGEVKVQYGSSDHGKSHSNLDEENVKSQEQTPEPKISCRMISPSGVREIDPVTEDDPIWLHAMDYRLNVSKVLSKVGPLWRAALILSLSEQLAKLSDDELNYSIEGDYMEQDFQEIRRGVIEQYDAFAASLFQLGMVGVWSQKPLIDGVAMKENVLPRIPKGPIFRDVMDEQISWMTKHPGCSKAAVAEHLTKAFPDFV